MQIENKELKRRSRLSIEDIKYILNNYETESIRQIALHLKKSWYRVHSYMQANNLVCSENIRGVNKKDAMNLCRDRYLRDENVKKLLNKKKRFKTEIDRLLHEANNQTYEFNK